MSLSDRIQELATVLQTRKRLPFEGLFEATFSRFDLVITFLAVLEMTRLRMTRIFQADALGAIWIETTDAPDEGDDEPEQPASLAEGAPEESLG
jgi:segregation and condensation protein A